MTAALVCAALAFALGACHPVPIALADVETAPAAGSLLEEQPEGAPEAMPGLVDVQETIPGGGAGMAASGETAPSGGGAAESESLSTAPEDAGAPDSDPGAPEAGPQEEPAPITSDESASQENPPARPGSEQPAAPDADPGDEGRAEGKGDPGDPTQEAGPARVTLVLKLLGQPDIGFVLDEFPDARVEEAVVDGYLRYLLSYTATLDEGGMPPIAWPRDRSVAEAIVEQGGRTWTVEVSGYGYQPFADLLLERAGVSADAAALGDETVALLAAGPARAGGARTITFSNGGTATLNADGTITGHAESNLASWYDGTWLDTTFWVTMPDGQVLHAVCVTAGHNAAANGSMLPFVAVPAGDGSYDVYLDGSNAPGHPGGTDLYAMPPQNEQTTVRWTPTVPRDGSVEITKASASPEATDGNPRYSLAGAVYELRGPDGGVVATLTTDDRGWARAEGVPAGDYSLVEVKAPSGFKLDATPIAVSVAADQTSYAAPKDAPELGAVELVKSSSDPQASQGGAYSLAGAAYELRDARGSVVATLVTGQDGKARADGVPAGAYTLVEVSAPRGFAVDATPIGIEVAPGQTARASHKDVPLLGSIAIDKSDADRGGPQGDATLEGATFDVIHAGDGPIAVGGRTVEPGGVACTLSTDAAGHAETGAILPLGAYRVVETAAPAGYELDEGWSQTVEVGDAATYPVAVADQVVRGSISLDKIDAETGAGVAQGAATLEGAKFSITNASPGNVVVDGTAFMPGQTVRVVSTDANGHACASGLPYGTYTVAEIEAPQGYLIPVGWSRTVVVHTSGNVSLTGDDRPCDEVARGGIALRKVDAQTLAPTAQGDASLEGARFSVVNASAGAVVVNGASVDPGDVVVELETDAAGYAETGAVLPYGDYLVVETAAPAGYLLAEGWSQTVGIRRDGEVVELAGDAGPKDEVVRGGVSLQKVDADTGEAVPQGMATLAGARFDIVNASAGSVVVGGEVVEPGMVAATVVTDEDGRASTAADALPWGTYEVVETLAPRGYRPSGLRQTVEVRGDGVVVACPQAFAEQVELGALDVSKVDAETGGAAALGAATLEGTRFAVVNNSTHAVVVEGATYLPGDTVMTLATDASGYAATAAVLPYGVYALREVDPPNGYTPGDGRVVNVEVFVDGQTSHAPDYGDVFSNRVKRGDLRFNKADEDTMARMGAVAFLIESATTGERHVVVSDENGSVDTSASWNPHTGNTNGNDAAADSVPVEGSALDASAGVWFSGSAEAKTTPRDDLGALPYDTYRVTELPCAANAGKRLVSFDVVVTRDAVDVDLGTVDDKPGPVVATELLGPGESHVVQASGMVELTDSVGYMNLMPGTYDLAMRLVFADTGEDVLDAGGAPVTATRRFQAVASSGIVRMTVSFDASALAGRSVVAFEELTMNGAPVASHADLSDANQTVSLVERPTIATTLSDASDGGHESSAAGTCKLVDVVEYSGLETGREYTLHGVLHDKRTGLAVVGADGRAVESTSRFVPERPSGTVEVVFEFDASLLAGSEVVAFEDLALGDAAVAVHHDIDDAAQTVRFPGIHTTLAGRDGQKEAHPDQDLVLVDTVAYTNLTPGLAYTVDGALMDAGTGQAVADGNGRAVVATATFTPESANGSVDVEFSFDARMCAGKTVVAFETLSRGGFRLAAHEDPKSPAQSVSILPLPRIGTCLTSRDGSHSVSSSIPVELVDTISYEGLEPGVAYVAAGALVVRETGRALTVAGETVAASAAFVPEKPDGTVDVVFELDPSALGLQGQTVVAFEALTREGADGSTLVVAVHEDISDAWQSVAFDRAFIATELTDAKGSHEVDAAGEVRLVDTVSYDGLATGQEYVLAGRLVDAQTGEPLLDAGGRAVEASTAFCAAGRSGTATVAFTVDASKLAGRRIVAFETLARADGALVATHEDLNDAAQTVSVRSPGDKTPPPEPPAPRTTVVRELVRTGDSIAASRTGAYLLAIAAMGAIALGTALAVRRFRHDD